MMCDRGPDLLLYRITPLKYKGIGFIACYDFDFGKKLDEFLRENNLALKDIGLEQATKDEYKFYFSKKYEEND